MSFNISVISFVLCFNVRGKEILKFKKLLRNTLKMKLLKVSLVQCLLII